jgi:hypothetical protein
MGKKKRCKKTKNVFVFKLWERGYVVVASGDLPSFMNTAIIAATADTIAMIMYSVYTVELIPTVLGDMSGLIAPETLVLTCTST